MKGKVNKSHKIRLFEQYNYIKAQNYKRDIDVN